MNNNKTKQYVLNVARGDTHLRQQGAGVGLGVSHSQVIAAKFKNIFQKIFSY